MGWDVREECWGIRSHYKPNTTQYKPIQTITNQLPPTQSLEPSRVPRPKNTGCDARAGFEPCPGQRAAGGGVTEAP